MEAATSHSFFSFYFVNLSTPHSLSLPLLLLISFSLFLHYPTTHFLYHKIPNIPATHFLHKPRKFQFLSHCSQRSYPFPSQAQKNPPPHSSITTYIPPPKPSTAETPLRHHHHHRLSRRRTFSFSSPTYYSLQTSSGRKLNRITYKFNSIGQGAGEDNRDYDDEEGKGEGEGRWNQKNDEEVERARLDGTIPGTSSEFVEQVSSRNSGNLPLLSDGDGYGESLGGDCC